MSAPVRTECTAESAFAFIQWLNTFDDVNIGISPSNACDADSDDLWTKFDALADGAILMQVLSQISPEHSDLADDSSEVRLENIVLVLEVHFECDLNDKLDTTRIDNSTGAELSAERLAIRRAELLRMIQLILTHAVQGERKEHYIQQIMALPDTTTQAQLMASIQEALTYLGVQACNRTDTDDAALEEEACAFVKERISSANNADSFIASGEACTPSSSGSSSNLGTSSGSSTNSAELEAALFEAQAARGKADRQMRALRDECNALKKQCEDERKQATRNKDEVIKLRRMAQEEEVRLELERVRAIGEERRQREKEICEKDEALSEARTEIISLKREMDGRQELLDELEILRPQQRRAERAEEQLARYGAKLEQLVAMREKIKCIETAHAELLAEATTLREVSARQPALLKELEAYKQKATTAEVAVSELKRRIGSGEQRTKHLMSQHDAVSGSESELRQQNEELRQQLLMMQEHLDQAESDALNGLQGGTSSAVGTGLTELNPELQAKIASLEHEVDSLRKQCDAESAENLAKLRAELDDTGRLKTSFEVKYFATDKKRCAAEKELAIIRTKLEMHDLELQNTRAQLAQTEEDSARALEAAALSAWLDSQEAAEREQTQCDNAQQAQEQHAEELRLLHEQSAMTIEECISVSAAEQLRSKDNHELQCIKFEATLSEVQTELASAVENHANEQAASQQKIDELVSSNKTLKAGLHKFGKLKKLGMAKLAQLKGKYTLAEQQLSESRTALKQTQAQLSDMDTKVMQGESLLRRERDQVKQLQRKLMAAESEAATLRHESQQHSSVHSSGAASDASRICTSDTPTQQHASHDEAYDGIEISQLRQQRRSEKKEHGIILAAKNTEILQLQKKVAKLTEAKEGLERENTSLKVRAERHELQRFAPMPQERKENIATGACVRTTCAKSSPARPFGMLAEITAQSPKACRQEEPEQCKQQ
eukprot:g2789.t1